MCLCCRVVTLESFVVPKCDQESSASFLPGVLGKPVSECELSVNPSKLDKGGPGWGQILSTRFPGIRFHGIVPSGYDYRLPLRTPSGFFIFMVCFFHCWHVELHLSEKPRHLLHKYTYCITC